MLNFSSLKPKIRKPARLRRGRGLGSGRGAYSGRGIKGQKARTGGNIKPGFEGGRQPFVRQIPKRKGFRSPHAKAQTIDLAMIASAFADGAIVSPKVLAERGLVRSSRLPIKVLGKGKAIRRLEFQGLRFSESAREAATQAGGKIREPEPGQND